MRSSPAVASSLSEPILVSTTAMLRAEVLRVNCILRPPGHFASQNMPEGRFESVRKNIAGRRYRDGNRRLAAPEEARTSFELRATRAARFCLSSVCYQSHREPLTALRQRMRELA